MAAAALAIRAFSAACSTSAPSRPESSVERFLSTAPP